MGAGVSLASAPAEKKGHLDLYFRNHSARNLASASSCNLAHTDLKVEDDKISTQVLGDILHLMKATVEGFRDVEKLIRDTSSLIERRLNDRRPGTSVQSFAIARSAFYAYESETSGAMPPGMYKASESQIISQLNKAGGELFTTFKHAGAKDLEEQGLDFNFGLNECHVMAAVIPAAEEYDTEEIEARGIETMLWDTLVIAYNPQGEFTTQEQSYVRLLSQMIETPWNSFTTRVIKEQDLMNQARLEKMTEHLNQSMDVSTVVLMILDEAKKFIDAEVCSMFLVDHTTDELVAFVFDSKAADTSEPMTSMVPIDGDTPVEPHETQDHSGCEVRIPINSSTIAGYVATNNVTLNIPDAYEDERFDPMFDKMTGFKTRNMLAIPIINNEGVIGVAEMINKKHSSGFTTRDERTFKNFIQHTATTLRHAQLYTESKRGVLQRESMLTVAKTIFTETNMKTLIYEIVLQAHKLIKCERCSCFLVDDVRGDLRSLVFDMGKNDVLSILEQSKKDERCKSQGGADKAAFAMFEEGTDMANDESAKGDDEDTYDYQIRIPKNHGIIGHVATTGQAVNISDAYSDPRFNREMDRKTGFKTRNLLVIAIPDNDGKVIGVVSMINKVGSKFDSGDERNLASFAIFCGVGIQSARLHARMAKEQKRTRIALEMIAYRTRAPQSKVDEVLAIPVPGDEWKLETLAFTPSLLDDMDKTRCIVHMFDNLGLLDEFKIDRIAFVRFVMTVGKNYRDVPFHNWDHAISVVHGCYGTLKRINANSQVISQIDKLALMVSCLCHDVDHRGTNNAFLSESGSELQSVYAGPSVLEKHHYDISMSILHNPDNYFLHQLSENDQQLVQDLIQENILATDLGVHSKQVLPKFKTLSREELQSTPVGKHMLRSLLMTCSDLSDSFRTWEVQQASAKRVYDEFFMQGDKEKAMGKVPIDMMNRDKANTPKHQIGFIDFVVAPLFKVAVEKFPEMQELLDNVNANRENWRKAGEHAHTQVAYADGEKVLLPSL